MEIVQVRATADRVWAGGKERPVTSTVTRDLTGSEAAGPGSNHITIWVVLLLSRGCRGEGDGVDGAGL